MRVSPVFFLLAVVTIGCNHDMIGAQNREMERQGKKPHPKRATQVVAVTIVMPPVTDRYALT